MKKSTIGIITLEILLILSVIAHNVFDIGKPKNIEHYIEKELLDYQSASLNYTLKYTMPEGYEEFENSNEEIAITNADNSALFVANAMPLEHISVEDFFRIQSSVFDSASTDKPNITEETNDKTTVDDKTITKKCFKIENSSLNLYALVATIEFKDKDEFIGVVGNVPSLDYEKDFRTLINSIDFTKQTKDKERIFANKNELVKVTIPANWLRFERKKNYSFYSPGETMIIASIESNNTENFDPNTDFQLIAESLMSVEGVSVIKDKETNVINNKTITTSIFSLDGQDIYKIVSLVQFEGSNVYTMAVYETRTKNIDSTLKDIEKITNSIELNKNYVSQDK